MREWIPIKQNEPPKDRLILFCGLKGGIFLGKYLGVQQRITGQAHVAADLRCSYHQRSVAAWLPVPEPYIDKEALAEYQKILNLYNYGRMKRSKKHDSAEV